MYPQDKSILFFTCADKAYEDFILLFALAILTNVPESLVEVGVEDPKAYREENEEALTFLKKKFGRERLLIRGADFTGDPAATRFVTNPLMVAEYVYITDVDLITLRGDIVDVHLGEMIKTGLPYSNKIRTGTQRMTGVHFAKYGTQYPVHVVPKILASTARMMNEEVLYYAMVAKGLPLPTGDFRPLFGIHMSPKRQAKDGDEKTGWGIYKFKKEWRVFRNTKNFKTLYRFFSGRIKNCVDITDFLVV